MTDLDCAILDFESQWWRARGNKEAAIREQFGWSPVRYAQKLNQILDNSDALAHNPHVVNRLRRIRSQRNHARKDREGLLHEASADRSLGPDRGDARRMHRGG
jgi:hypothetical protein